MSASSKAAGTDSWTANLPGLDRGDRLDSWKEIAAYLRREVRTVQLWEKNEGLPVRRHFHKQLGSVFAFRSEIDSWSQQASRKNSLLKGLPESPGSLQTEPKGVTVGILPLVTNSTNRDHRQLCADIARKTITTLQSLSAEFISIVEIGSAISAHVNYLVKWESSFDERRFAIEIALVAQEGKANIWSHRQSWDHAKTAGLANTVVDQITQCLWLKLISCRPQAASSAAAPSQQASREAYLTGRYFWNQRSEQGMRKAIRYFESAIDADPNFALAYSGLADCLTLLSFYEIAPPTETMPAAKKAALKALELDANLAEAHTSLADVYLHFDRNWAKADEEYRRAIECNPGYALAYHWYANLLIAKGQHEAAQMAMSRALEIDPISPTALVWAGVTSHLARRYDAAIDYYKRAVDFNPQFVWAYLYMAQSLEQKGAFSEAIQTLDHALTLAPTNACIKAIQAHTYAISGNKPLALAILDELENTSILTSFPAYDVAAVYAALGQANKSIKWLKSACKARSMRLFTLAQDPRFDSLRARIDFQAILREAGFE